MLAKALCFRAVRPPLSFVRSFVCSSGQILLPWYLMSNFDDTYRELITKTDHQFNTVPPAIRPPL